MALKFARLKVGGVFVAELDGTLAGFVRVEENGFVDLLYVHPNYERGGVGRTLMQTAKSWAVNHGASRFEAEVSIAARVFFEAMGFVVEEEQTVERKGILLTNFHMTRNVDAEQTLSADAPTSRG